MLVQRGATQYAQDLAAPLSQVLTDSTATYVYGHERLTALGQTWYVGDALGSVRQTLDSAGAVQATASYAPFGEAQGSTIAPFGFTGELQDAGLVHLRARWYDPSNGVFTGVDPFSGFPETPYSLHPYQYAHGNPLINSDPSGFVCTGIGTIDAATGCNDAVSDAVNDIIVCGPKPESNDLISPRYWCNPTTHQWEVVSMGMVIVAPAPGVVQGAGRVGDLLRACATALAAAAGASMSDVNVDTQTEDDSSAQTIVELGPGVNANNLLLLAASFPNAKVYGIERDSSAATLLRIALSHSGGSDRIKIVETNYATYAGVLKNQADIVVALAPNPHAPIEKGIQNFAKPGGQVQVVTELRSTKDDLQSQFGYKSIVREVSTVRGSQGDYLVLGTSMGLPFTSPFLGGDVWEVYMPSW